MHYKAERTLDRIDDMIGQAKLEGLSQAWLKSLFDLRKEIIELGKELDDADFDTWLSNHQGLLDDDYNE